MTAGRAASPVRVRAARADEGEAVAALINALNTDGRASPAVPMTAEMARRDLLGPSPWCTLLVAELDGALVGYVTGQRIYDTAHASGGLLLGDLYVVPKARRRGVGRALLARLAAEARQGGGRFVWWGVEPGDDAALSLCLRLGAQIEPILGALVADYPFDRLAEEARG